MTNMNTDRAKERRWCRMVFMATTTGRGRRTGERTKRIDELCDENGGFTAKYSLEMDRGSNPPRCCVTLVVLLGHSVPDPMTKAADV